MIPHIQSVHTFASVLGYLRLFLSCTKYHSVLLLHDNQSADLSKSIMHEVHPFQNIFWLPTNMDRDQLFASSEFSQMYRNPNSLILNLIHGPEIAHKFKAFRKALEVNEKCDNLIVTGGRIDNNEMQSVLHVVLEYSVVNIGVLYEDDSQEVRLMKLYYDSFSVRPVNLVNQSCAEIKANLFYDKTQDLRNQEIVIHMFFEVPRVINLTQIAKDASDQYPYDVGGRDAYLSTLIDYRFGTRSTRLAKKYSQQFIIENYELSKFFVEFMDKPYREDGLRPGALDYMLLDDQAFDDYTINKTVINMESMISAPPGMHPLYPHEVENYILCVANDVHEQSKLLDSILKFPLFSVWSFTIITITLVRLVLRAIQKSPHNYFSPILFNTCGLSFGTVTSVVVSNRPERVLLLFVSLFTLVSGILCSGLLFQKIATFIDLPDITSLEQLGEHLNFDIYLPEDFDVETEEWLREQVSNRIVRLDKNRIMAMVYAKHTNSAYIISDAMTESLLHGADMLDIHGHNLFHEIKYTIIRQPLHFVVDDWFLVEKLSKLVQQSIEHGFMQHFAKRSQNIIKEFKVDVGGNPGSTEFVSITTDKLNFVFVIYLSGNGGAIIVFLGELMWVRWKRYLRKRLAAKA